MNVSLILTVLNEADSIAPFLDSLEKQTRLPDEVVICDALSTDGTVEILKNFASSFPRPVKVVEEPGNRSRGRNIAISNAENELIAGTDAGCILDPNWLKCLVAPFERDPSTDVVSGFYVAKGETLFEKCAAVVTLSTKDVVPADFLPSARSVAFRKSAWEAVGGFPEDLDFAEDTKFDLDLRAANMHFAFAGDAIVYWRPRNSQGQVFRQLRNYARGNVEAGILLRNYVRVHIRYLVWVVLTAALFLTPWALVLWSPAVLLYWAKWSVAGWRESFDWRSIFITPWIKLVADAGQFAGFWSSICRRGQA